jgi:hypothetical protein
MRTKPITNARDKLAYAIEKRETITLEELLKIVEDVYQDVRLAALFARNAASKGFLATTNMSEDQIKQTPQYQRIVNLGPGEGCTLEVTSDLYKYIRWIIKRDNPIVRLRTIKLGDNIMSVSRVDS